MSRKKEQPKDEFKSRSRTKKMHALKEVENSLPPGEEIFSWDNVGTIYMPSLTEPITFTPLPKEITDAAFDRMLRSCEEGFYDTEPDLSVVRYPVEYDPEDNDITVHSVEEEEAVQSKVNIVNIDDESIDEDMRIINRFLLSKQKKDDDFNWHTQGDCNVVKIEAFKSEKVYPSTSKAAYSSSSEIVDPTTSRANWPSTSNEELQFMLPTIKSEASSSTTFDGPSTSAPVTDMKVCFAEIEQLLSEDKERNRLMFSAPTPPPCNREMFKSNQNKA